LELSEECRDLRITLGLARLAREARQRDRCEDSDQGDDDHDFEERETRLPAMRSLHGRNVRPSDDSREAAAGLPSGIVRIASEIVGTTCATIRDIAIDSAAARPSGDCWRSGSV